MRKKLLSYHSNEDSRPGWLRRILKSEDLTLSETQTTRNSEPEVHSNDLGPSTTLSLAVSSDSILRPSLPFDDSILSDPLSNQTSTPPTSSSPTPDASKIKPYALSGVKSSLKASQALFKLAPIPNLDLVPTALLKFVEMYEVSDVPSRISTS